MTENKTKLFMARCNHERAFQKYEDIKVKLQNAMQDHYAAEHEVRQSILQRDLLRSESRNACSLKAHASILNTSAMKAKNDAYSACVRSKVAFDENAKIQYLTRTLDLVHEQHLNSFMKEGNLRSFQTAQELMSSISDIPESANQARLESKDAMQRFYQLDNEAREHQIRAEENKHRAYLIVQELEEELDNAMIQLNEADVEFIRASYAVLSENQMKYNL